MLNPKYKLTHTILNMLTAIAEARTVIERAKILPRQEFQLRRQALIRMTHSSTHIEGNLLNLQQVEAILRREKIDAPSRDIYEVENYLKALRYIGQVVEKKQRIGERTILKIHALVTNRTLPKEQSGHYRKSSVYVVKKRLGMPSKTIYTAPDAKKVPQLMKGLVEWAQKTEKNRINPVIVAGVAHAEIAAIHPFVDGNGRTARAVATLILYERGYDFRKLFALEDYYNANRPAYYKAINMGKTYEEREADFTRWLEYFVRGLKEEVEEVRNKVSALALRKVDQNIDSKIYLDRAQIKILEFMDQMNKITVQDVISILECPKRTAQLYLQRLKKLHMIKQVGKGPSSAYVLK